MRFTVFPNLNPKAFEVYHALLHEKFAYFRLLNDREQRIFVSRLRYVRNNKQFVGRDIDITEEMEVIVSASLVQLTFGLKQFDFVHNLLLLSKWVVQNDTHTHKLLNNDL